MTTDVLPRNVMSLLKNGKFCHLGTSYQDVPHVSLMNYTYIVPEEGSPYADGPLVILASGKDTQKFANIQKNPKISLLIHDWVTAGRGNNSDFSTATDSLSRLLQEMNQNEMSAVSATFGGEATILSGDKAEYFRQKLLADNSKEARCFIERAEVIAVKIYGAKVTDKENHSNTAVVKGGFTLD